MPSNRYSLVRGRPPLMRGSGEPGGSATPGASAASEMKLRPFNGRLSIFSRDTTCPRLDVALRRSGASAVTVSASLTVPSSRSRSTRMVSPVATCTPPRTSCWKPSSVAVSQYGPGGSALIWKLPSASVTVDRRRPVDSFSTATAAPGNGAPPGSRTLSDDAARGDLRRRRRRSEERCGGNGDPQADEERRGQAHGPRHFMSAEIVNQIILKCVKPILRDPVLPDNVAGGTVSFGRRWPAAVLRTKSGGVRGAELASGR